MKDIPMQHPAPAQIDRMVDTLAAMHPDSDRIDLEHRVRTEIERVKAPGIADITS